MEKLYKFEINTLDVWGNETYGYEVNDKFKTGKNVFLSEAMTDAQTLEKIAAELNLDASAVNLECLGDFSIMHIVDKKTEEPFYEVIMSYETTQEYYNTGN